MAFEGMKLVAAPKRDSSDPVAKRLARLIMQIDHQLYMAEPANRTQKFRGRWWTVDIDGKATLAIKYGKVALELAKGKHAIACANVDGVIEALKQARALALDGTFDSQLTAISEQVRARFKKG